MMKENEEKVKYLTQVEMKKVFRSLEKDSSKHYSIYDKSNILAPKNNKYNTLYF